MKYLLRQPWVLTATVGVAALLAMLYVVNIGGVEQLAAANQRISLAQSRQNHLTDYLRNLIDMETGQRGYLLTHDARYLQPYTEAAPTLNSLGDELTEEYRRAGSSADQKMVQEIRTLTATKLGELEGTLRLDEQVGPGNALALVKTNLGVDVSDQVRALIGQLVGKERAAVADSILIWDRDLSRIRNYLLFSTALNVLLVLLFALLFSGALGRREDRVRLLDNRLHQRNAELSSLSTHLQQLSEVEKANLARELHDELGGLLVASRMDAVWLQRQLGHADAEIKLRLQRIAHTLNEGLDLKRRIIESLRPTLLDNMGLIPALRWLFDETCQRAGLQGFAQLPTEEPALGNDARIALFRIVQEALTNVLRHAQAKQVTLLMRALDDTLLVSIQDNGVGLSRAAASRDTHGLVNMRHRAFSLGGECVIEPAAAGGTVVTVTVPLASTLPAATES